MPSQKDYENHAQHTLTAIRQQLVFGSNAKIGAKRSDYKRLYLLRAMVLFGQIQAVQTLGEAAIHNKFPMYAKLRSLAVKRYGYGNCAEIAYAGFVHLLNKHVYPIEIVHTSVGKHLLVLEGRKPDSDINDRTTWGEKATLCDIWANRISPATELESLQADPTYGQYALGQYPHVMSGVLEPHLSLMTSESLNQFKANMQLPESITNLFPNNIASAEDLNNDIKELERFYQLIQPSYAHIPAAQLELDTWYNYIRLYKGTYCQEEANREARYRGLTLSGYSIFQQPEDCIDWCNPPPGSQLDAEGRTVVVRR